MKGMKCAVHCRVARAAVKQSIKPWVSFCVLNRKTTGWVARDWGGGGLGGLAGEFVQVVTSVQKRMCFVSSRLVSFFLFDFFFKTKERNQIKRKEGKPPHGKRAPL